MSDSRRRHAQALAPGRFGGWFRRAAAAAWTRCRCTCRCAWAARSMTQTKAAPMRVLGFDQALVWVTVALLAWGLVMVYSASIALPDNPRFARAGYGPMFFLARHAAVPGHRLRRRAAGLPDPDADLGARRAVDLRRVAAAAGGGAHPARGPAWSTARAAGCRWAS